MTDTYRRPEQPEDSEALLSFVSFLRVIRRRSWLLVVTFSSVMAVVSYFSFRAINSRDFFTLIELGRVDTSEVRLGTLNSDYIQLNKAPSERLVESPHDVLTKIKVVFLPHVMYKFVEKHPEYEIGDLPGVKAKVVLKTSLLQLYSQASASQRGMVEEIHNGIYELIKSEHALVMAAEKSQLESQKRQVLSELVSLDEKGKLLLARQGGLERQLAFLQKQEAYLNEKTGKLSKPSKLSAIQLKAYYDELKEIKQQLYIDVPAEKAAIALNINANQGKVAKRNGELEYLGAILSSVKNTKPIIKTIESPDRVKALVLLILGFVFATFWAIVTVLGVELWGKVTRLITVKA